MTDISFRTAEHAFSYRVAGICVKNGRVLLQRATNDTGFAFPGGQAAFGETNAQTLEREFMEEMSAEVRVGALRWVAEIFFSWHDTPCQQICLYYDVELADGQPPADGMWIGSEHMEGRDFDIEFQWVPLDELDALEVYPPQAKALLRASDKGVAHIIYSE